MSFNLIEGCRKMRGESQEPHALDSRVNSFPSVQGDELCAACHDSNVETYFCNDCDIFLCTEHWSEQIAHRPQNLKRGRKRHEKTDVSLARKVNNVLMPPSNLKELTQLHENDAATAWFGRLVYVNKADYLLMVQGYIDLRMEAPRCSWTTADLHTF